MGSQSNQGANPRWIVAASLSTLPGLMESAILLIREADQSMSRNEKQYIAGRVSSAVILASYSTEIALKTLFVQTKTQDMPPRSYDLLDLFESLDQHVQDQVQNMFETMTPIGQHDWIDQNESVRSMIEMGRTNFVDWRFLMERLQTGGGVPKSLINICQAVMLVCLRYPITQ